MSEHPEHDPQWLKKLVARIKEKDHDAASEFRERERRAQILPSRGPLFWNAFGDFLTKFIQEMKAEFAGDATAGELTISIDPQTRAIEIKKSAFPFAVCIALPNFKGAANNVKYSVCNPEQLQRLVCGFHISKSTSTCCCSQANSYNRMLLW